ncbi:MAG: hypothetical protein ACYS4W_10250 [Planctomycetota bacterium]
MADEWNLMTQPIRIHQPLGCGRISWDYSMINISRLYCDQIAPGDWIRYGRKGSGDRDDTGQDQTLQRSCKDDRHSHG